MAEKLFVVQIFSNGDRGFPEDEVAEIGVASLDSAGNVVSEFSSMVGCDIWNWSGIQRGHYESVSGNDFECLYSEPPAEQVSAELRDLIRGGEVTSYDVSNAIGKYLVYEPWDITFDVEITSSICSRATGVSRPRDSLSELEAIKAVYAATVGNPPSGKLSALDYASMSAAIAAEYRLRGLF